MQDHEKLGLFYLGRPLDDSGQPLDASLLYDARDLVTHARGPAREDPRRSLR